MPDYNAWAGIGAAASAITSIFAAVAAVRSAASARSALERGGQEARRAMEREASLLTNRVLVIAERIEEIADDPDRAYQTLFTFADHRGDSPCSRGTGCGSRAAETEAQGHRELARPVSQCGLGGLGDCFDGDLADLIREMDGRLVKLDGIRESLNADLASVEAQNAQHRARALQVGRIPPEIPV